MLPGGRAPEYLRLNHQVLDAVRHFAREKKPIAAICHAAQLLTAAGVVEGKRVSAYPACAPDIEIAGGTYASIGMAEAIADGDVGHRSGVARARGLAGKIPGSSGAAPTKQPEKQQEARFEPVRSKPARGSLADGLS